MTSTDEAMKEMVKKLEDDARAKAEAGNDGGHNELADDVQALLNDVKSYEFHDYLNERFASPKAALAEILHTMREKVISGKYDN